jgi:hypothetical protein
MNFISIILNKKRISFWILIGVGFFSFNFSIFSSEKMKIIDFSKLKKYQWNKLTLKKIEKNDETSISFIRKDNKKIYIKSINQTSKVGILKSKNDSFLYIQTFSGGESGGSQEIEFYSFKNNQFKLGRIETSGYNEFKIFNRKNKFLFFSLNSSLFFETEFPCICSSSQPLYLQGYSDLNLPMYFEIVSNKKSLSFRNITFENSTLPYINFHLKRIYNSLKNSESSTITDPNQFSGIAQFGYYLHQLKNPIVKLMELEKLNTKIKSNCENNLDIEIQHFWKELLLSNQTPKDEFIIY